MSEPPESTGEKLDVRFERPPQHYHGKAGLCLSGGGYRAMLFHTGAVLRLMQLGLFREGKIKRISSVSGGSILAGLLAQHWDSIKTGDVDAFRREIMGRVLEVSSTLLDVRAVLMALAHRSQPAREVAALYEANRWGDRAALGPLFNPDKKLKDLPGKSSNEDERVEFVFNATDLNSGERWTFSRTQTSSHSVNRPGSVRVHGKKYDPGQIGPTGSETITIAEAVAASGAFPPILSPMLIDVDTAPENDSRTRTLVDGGVYDNIGLDTLKPYNTILVSDAGGVFDRASFIGFSFGGLRVPAQLMRVFNVVDGRSRSQVRYWLWQVLRNSLDQSSTDQEVAERRTVAYWTMEDAGMRDELGLKDWSHQPKEGRLLPIPADVIHVDDEMASRLARVSTRLAPVDTLLAKQLINLGYARCDRYARTMATKRIPNEYPAPQLPYPEAPLDRKPVDRPRASIQGPVIRLTYVAAMAWLLITFATTATFAILAALLMPGVAGAALASPGAAAALLVAMLGASILIVSALVLVTVFVVWRKLCMPAHSIATETVGRPLTG